MPSCSISILDSFLWSHEAGSLCVFIVAEKSLLLSQTASLLAGIVCRCDMFDMTTTPPDEPHKLASPEPLLRADRD